MGLTLDWEKYTQTARLLAAEGAVLLKNEKKALPLCKGAKVALFGRIQSRYYRSGTGSGGMVNVDKVYSILDGLREDKDVCLDEELISIYTEWEKEHPFDEGIGWAGEPWSQEEMELSEELVRTCEARNDVAVYIVGRTAGEDQDNVDEKGAYRLSETERLNLEKITEIFDTTVIVYNTGGIMDMTEEVLDRADALLLGWQGGMIGGLAVADLLTGKVTPSGHLSDTIARKISDYPAYPNFGDEKKDYYKEDIYVGYRYFETMAKEKVLYPFGFGLSYTSFEITDTSVINKGDDLQIEAVVKNTGDTFGKQVVQVYVEAPQGRLGKAARVLVGFAKTKKLLPGEEQRLTIEATRYSFSSYDDYADSKTAYCYVAEKGEYKVYVGFNVREAKEVFAFSLAEDVITAKCGRALAPIEPFERMRGDGSFEQAPWHEKEEEEKRLAHLPKEIPYKGDQGITLVDVMENRASKEDFLAQFTVDDLCCIIRGEGMGSPKGTPGTAAVYGGVSAHLDQMGIPCGCCSDGPSGMRIDCGMKAFSLPNGTLMACSFDTPLVEQLYSYLGLEMRSNRIDNILGPGMNIHRFPLNGRNFEYFSEDPLLTGKMAAAQERGLHSASVTGTMKHFAANNQEKKRNYLDSVVSERALREIYLKGYEIAIKEGGADSVMTTYGKLNGSYTSGRYELNTTILREEWGFTGIVMTDWWAQINSQKTPEVTKNDFASIARAQNDLYMVCQKGNENLTGDNTEKALKEGELSLGELQRNAWNICKQLATLPAMARKLGKEEKVLVENRPVYADDINMDDVVYYDLDDNLTIPLSAVDTTKGKNFVFAMQVKNTGQYRMKVHYSSDLTGVAQTPVTLLTQNVPISVLTFNGTGGEVKEMEKLILIAPKYVVVRLSFGASGVKLQDIQFEFIQPMEPKNLLSERAEANEDYEMVFV